MVNAHAVAASLATRFPDEASAFLIAGDAVHFATSLLEEHRPHTAVTQLVQGIFERDPANALFLLRRRIFATYPPSRACKDMVKVAAKRLEHITLEASRCADPVSPTLLWRRESYDVGRGMDAVHEDCPPLDAGTKTLFKEDDPGRVFAWLNTCLAKRDVHWPAERFLRDRRVAAAACDGEGRLLAAAFNGNARNKTRHAEITLVQAHWETTGRPLPKGARVYVTLKPCRMCSAMLVRACASPEDLKVYYWEEDAGPMARATQLEERGCLKGPFAPLSLLSP